MRQGVLLFRVLLQQIAGLAFYRFVSVPVALEGLYQRCLGLFVAGLAALFEVADCGIAPVVGYQHLEIVA